MDNDLQDLEAELQRLRPIAPSRAVADNVAHLLTPAPRHQRGHWAWAALPLAAIVAGVVVLRERPAATQPDGFVESGRASGLAGATLAATNPAAAYKPVSAENLLYAQTDEGLVTLADGTTAQRTRSAYVDTITWRNPHTQASLKWSVPRTEERIIPVSFQ